MTEIEPGRYICVRTGGPVGWLIRKATRSPVNHAFIVGPAGLIVEARPTGVRVSALTEYAGCLAVANLHDPMDPAQGLEIWSAALAMCGDGYDFADLLALGAESLGWHWRLVFKLLGTGRWRICSQLVCMAGQGCVPPMNWLCKQGEPDEVTPAALARRPGVVPIVIGKG